MKKILSVNTPGKPFIKRIISWTAVILFSVLIIVFSSQPGDESNNLSQHIVQDAKEAKKYMTQEAKEIKGQIAPDLKTGGVLGNTLRDIKNWVHKVLLLSNKQYNHIIRKAAHFTEYFILAVLFYIVLSVSGVRRKKSLLFTVLFCIIFAAVDEYHQRFIYGRTSRPTDVIIDCSGAFTAAVIMYFYMKKKLRPDAE